MFKHPHTIANAPSISEFAMTEEEDVQLTPLSEDYPLHLVSEFKACVIGDMLVYKLGAFITDLNAQLISIDDNQVLMKIGRRRFMPSWSGCEYDRPIEIELSITPVDDSGTHSTARRCQINTCIRPVGWVRNKAGYEQKVRELIRSLKSYFMAD
ncbi:hypothetical protein Pla110_29520 [Polystyrenella longa]|uniref:Uncharacterized protein n=1 Tax=Polystyrenella longa TaxID=2528007 RepID=A0A518CPR8_9PLAN|nr:hypothetical protein [Polystyrenella longa]QDU81213.1 hypothetical protein Pla110_29520 [Polystyrenella longa]